MERHQGVWVPEGVRVITHNFCHDLDKDFDKDLKKYPQKNLKIFHFTFSVSFYLFLVNKSQELTNPLRSIRNKKGTNLKV